MRKYRKSPWVGCSYKLLGIKPPINSQMVFENLIYHPSYDGSIGVLCQNNNTGIYFLKTGIGNRSIPQDWAKNIDIKIKEQFKNDGNN